MPARPIWRAILSFEDVELPVRLYSALQNRKVRFRLLHDRDKVPLKQQMVNPKTGKEVERSEILKGAEVERGVFVVLHDDELASLEPEPSRVIQIKRFVDPGKISHQWYDRPYYLGPDSEDQKSYWSFVAALERQKKEGVARWVMRRKNYVGALRAERGYLMLITLRFAGEVLSPTDLKAPGGRALDRKEMQLAQQLVSALKDKFKPEEYHDEFRERVLELVQAKARGKKVKLKKVERRPAPKSIEEALEASLEKVGELTHA